MTKAETKAERRPLVPKKPLAKPPSIASDAKIKKPVIEASIVDKKLIWFVLSRSRFTESVNDFAVVPATKSATTPIV